MTKQELKKLLEENEVTAQEIIDQLQGGCYETSELDRVVNDIGLSYDLCYRSTQDDEWFEATVDMPKNGKYYAVIFNFDAIYTVDSEDELLDLLLNLEEQAQETILSFKE